MKGSNMRRGLGPALLFSLLVCLGCSGQGDLPPGIDTDGASRGAGVLVGPCDDGAEHSCHEQLGLANGVLTCWNGTQNCDGGRWGDCVDGEITEHPAPKQASQRPGADLLSLSGNP